MKLHDARIENFKGIDVVEFVANGNNITLRGMNGSCKTATLEAIATLLFGKKVLPDDPIMHGKESAMLQCTLSDAGEIKYKIRAKIGKQFKIEVFTFTPSGHELEVKKPVDFLSSLVTRDFIDPDEFVKKKGVERIKLLYSLLPDLQGKVDDINADYEDEQAKRSAINVDKTRVSGLLANVQFTPDLPEEEINPVDLMNKLEAANTHNKEKEDLVEDLENLTGQITDTSEEITETEQDIESLLKEIEEKKADRDRLKLQLKAAEELRDNKSDLIDAFEETPIDDIKLEISQLSEKNTSIRNNKVHADLTKELGILSIKYSAGLEKMRKLNQDKIVLFKNVKMPIDGLSILEDDIAFPDPRTGEVVKFSSLSTGQKYTVAVPILSAFLPDPKDGIRAMIINDLNAIDDPNLEAVLGAAKDNDVQLVMHKTVGSSESNKLEIVIE